MASLRVRNTQRNGAQRLRTQSAALTGGAGHGVREQAAERLAEFRHRTAGRGSAPSGELLRESRSARVEALTGFGEDT